MKLFMGSQSFVDRLEAKVGLRRTLGLTGDVEFLRREEVGESGTGEEGKDMAGGSTRSSCSKKAA